ncbi:hypothetical protein K8T06_09175 [bacterium]|nr:hypothetical protein [bacterium]
MLTRSNLSVVLIAVVLAFVTLTCCAQDWACSTLPVLPSPGPDSVIVDTTGVAHIYNSSSNWHCWGNLNQPFQVETVTECDVVCLDLMVEEDETHAAYICFNGKVYYQWRRPDSSWQIDLVESFRPESVERVEIERAPDGTLWLVVLYNNRFYLYEHTDHGWNDYIVETMPAQFKDQSLWRFEIDWENHLQLVRQISPIGFYHLTGTPGDWSNAIINNVEGFPGDTREFELTGMEMRKNNTPILHVTGIAQIGDSYDSFTGTIFNNSGDWEAADKWMRKTGVTAYDDARDRIHSAYSYYHSHGYAHRYWSVPLGDDSREAYLPPTRPDLDSINAMTIGKLDLPHLVGRYYSNYMYYRPPADIYIDVVQQHYSSVDPNLGAFGFNVINWKWNRSARVGFVMEIVGQFYWWPNWSSVPSLPTMEFDTGSYLDELLTVQEPTGEYGVDVTFYTALLHPVDDVFLNGASWDMLTVTY